MKIFLTLLTVLILPFSIFGQVAAPSLNPFQPSKLAATSTWRYASTIGFEQENSKGETDVRTNGTDWLQSGDQDLRDSTGLMAFRWDPVTLEISSNNYSDSYVRVDGSPDVQSEFRNVDINLSYRIDLISVGLSQKQRTSKITQNNQTFNEDKEKSTGLSFDWMINEILFLAAGIDRVSVEKTDTNVGNEWDQSTVGVAVVSGYPGLEVFSFEMFYQYSPESLSEAEGALAEHKQYSLETIGSSLGWQKYEYLFSVSTERMVSDQSDSFAGTAYDQESAYSKTRADIGYSPLNGLAFVVSATLHETTTNQTILGNTLESKAISKGYSVGVGFNF